MDKVVFFIRTTGAGLKESIQINCLKKKISLNEWGVEAIKEKAKREGIDIPREEL